MSNRLGICIVGLNGAVATTVVAGQLLMKKKLTERNGMITETKDFEKLGLAPVDDIVFGGWDLLPGSTYEWAQHHHVLKPHVVDQVKAELQEVKAWPGVVSEKFMNAMAKDKIKNVVSAPTFRKELEILQGHIEGFKKQHQLDNVVIVNLTSTEKYTEVSDVHRTIEAFEKGLDANDERISPAMKFLYLACKMGIPHANFTPSLSKIPALEKLSDQTIPICGEDGKTGQTLLKTVLAPMFVVRQLKVRGWFSTNILGNNDGLVLNDPAANKTKVTSKMSVLDSVLGYKVPFHQVHIHYYEPRGDDKEAWDNIDIEGWAGENMQLKMNFLCKDSILAAPLVIDMARILAFAKAKGEKGIQRQMSVFFKSPYHTEGETPVHDLFRQYTLLENWSAKHGGKA
ncbi:MAG: inositol-3-phosphate synthase [Myxococcales bacterium]